MIWRLFQMAVVFGVIWFFIEVAPAPEVPLFSKAFLGVVIAFIFTAIVSSALNWLARRRQKRIYHS